MTYPWAIIIIGVVWMVGWMVGDILKDLVRPTIELFKGVPKEILELVKKYVNYKLTSKKEAQNDTK